MRKEDRSNCWESILFEVSDWTLPRSPKKVSRCAGEDSPECSTLKTPTSCLRDGFRVDFGLECCDKCHV